MSRVKEVDPVLEAVKRAVLQFGLHVEGPMGQQILLLGETFYGYRFTGKGFTAVWSAADLSLNVFDQHGKRVGTSILSVSGEKIIDTHSSIRLPEQQENRRAA